MTPQQRHLYRNAVLAEVSDLSDEQQIQVLTDALTYATAAKAQSFDARRVNALAKLIRDAAR